MCNAKTTCLYATGPTDGAGGAQRHPIPALHWGTGNGPAASWGTWKSPAALRDRRVIGSGRELLSQPAAGGGRRGRKQWGGAGGKEKNGHASLLPPASLVRSVELAEAARWQVNLEGGGSRSCAGRQGCVPKCGALQAFSTRRGPGHLSSPLPRAVKGLQPKMGQSRFF